jgi:hypothetical protein
MMKAVNTSQTPANLYQTTRRNILEDGHIHLTSNIQEDGHLHLTIWIISVKLIKSQPAINSFLLVLQILTMVI